jgi:hypothetical protein
MEGINVPVWGKNAPDPERSGGLAWFLRCPLTGHRSKNHDKGGYGIHAPILGTKAVVGEGKRFGKTAEQFLPTMGVLGGEAH